VEKDALKALADLELDSLADRSKLEAQMKKAKSRFEEPENKVRQSGLSNHPVRIIYGGAYAPLSYDFDLLMILAIAASRSVKQRSSTLTVTQMIIPSP
jgi:hypothetical protein